MEVITLTKDNLDKEHICCAISSNKDCQVVSKKQWLSKRFDDGLVFKKCDVRGKCFIEYIPAEKRGHRLKLTGTCILTVFGCPDSLRAKEMPICF